MKLPEIQFFYGNNQDPGGVQEAVARPSHEFWRYLLAGLLAAGQSAGTNGDTALPSQVVSETDALLAELEKGGES